MSFRDVIIVLVISLAIATVLEAKRRGDCNDNNDIANNLTALWTKVNTVSKPFKVFIHQEDQCDSYFGCAYGDHHSHSYGSHHHSSHGHGNHSHSHAHGHGHHGHSHGSHSNENHLHIYLSLNGQGTTSSYKFKDEYVYARCDMVAADKKVLDVKGSILMRQKPHKAMESIIKLKGFKGASEGVKDGKHDYFFDIHPFADFKLGCDSFGEHDHVHEHTEGDGHDHDHDHLSKDDDWGNVIIKKNGKVKMEVNTTRHELFGPKAILGREIVLHDKNDKAVCCCAITYAKIKDEDWAM